MRRRKVIESYIALLGRGESEGLIGLFAESGMVISPLYGRKTAAEFFRGLARETRASELTPQGIYLHADDPLAAALAFHYRWTLRDGRQVAFECVDLFRFDEAYRIASLTIVYDTHAVRPLPAGLATVEPGSG